MTFDLEFERPKLHQLRKLTEVSRALTYASSLEQVFQLTVDHARDLLGGDPALIMVLGPDNRLEVRASSGVDPAAAEHWREPLSETLVERLATLLVVPAGRFLIVPLVVAGNIAGVLVVIRAAVSSPSEHDEWLLSALADQAAVALEQARLYESAERREQLIGIVGHDLRHPLQTISLAAQFLLMREGLGNKEADLVRRISTSAASAGRLVSQLVDLTRSRLGGGIPIERARFDLSEVCRDLVAEAELTSPDRPLQVEWLGQLDGKWDRDRMQQLLANLLANAVQHGEPLSPIELRFDGSGAEVVLEVGSRGPLIAPALLPVIFEAFRKLRSASSRGLGLGLYISQQIARAHGGEITVSSSEPRTTTFRVRVPRAALAGPIRGAVTPATL